MFDVSNILKSHFETDFSMPFDVDKKVVSGEDHYRIIPRNDSDGLFVIDVHLHNSVRVTVVAVPQLHAGAMVDDMRSADKQKVSIFKEFGSAIKAKGADVKFSSNGIPVDINAMSSFPSDAKTFELRISRTGLYVEPTKESIATTLYDWSSLVMSMILSLLTVQDTSSLVDGYEEGNQYEVKTKRYERSAINRKLCLAIHGYKCQICGFDFEDKYGNLGKGFIHVHHVTPVSLIGPGYVIDPAKDLIPVCPNCHAMLHRQYPPLMPEQLVENILDANDID